MQNVMTEFKTVELSSIKVDRAYQRDHSIQAVEKMAENWHDAYCAPMIVGQRRKAHYIIDGHHRLKAMRLLEIKSAKVKLIRNTTQTLEAHIFRMQNSRKKMDALDRFRAEVCEGVQASVSLNNFLSKAGVKINYHQEKSDEFQRYGLRAIQIVQQWWNCSQKQKFVKHGMPLLVAMQRNRHEPDRATFQRLFIDGFFHYLMENNLPDDNTIVSILQEREKEKFLYTDPDPTNREKKAVQVAKNIRSAIQRRSRVK